MPGKRVLQRGLELTHLSLTADKHTAGEAVQNPRFLGLGCRFSRAGAETDRLQASEHVRGGGRSLRGILGEQPLDERLQRPRAKRVVPARRHRRRVDVLSDDGNGVISQEWRPAGDQLVQHRPQRVEVGRWRDVAAGGLLRRHVGDGPDHHAGLGETGAVDGDS